MEPGDPQLEAGLLAASRMSFSTSFVTFSTVSSILAGGCAVLDQALDGDRAISADRVEPGKDDRLGVSSTMTSIPSPSPGRGCSAFRPMMRLHVVAGQVHDGHRRSAT